MRPRAPSTADTSAPRPPCSPRCWGWARDPRGARWCGWRYRSGEARSAREGSAEHVPGGQGTGPRHVRRGAGGVPQGPRVFASVMTRVAMFQQRARPTRGAAVTTAPPTRCGTRRGVGAAPVCRSRPGRLVHLPVTHGSAGFCDARELGCPGSPGVRSAWPAHAAGGRPHAAWVWL